jgi:hypothetical protein
LVSNDLKTVTILIEEQDNVPLTPYRQRPTQLHKLVFLKPSFGASLRFSIGDNELSLLKIAVYLGLPRKQETANMTLA